MGVDKVVADNIEIFINGLIHETRRKNLKWKRVSKIKEWVKLKKEIESTKEVDLKDYFIDTSKSYCITQNEGYVMILNIRYGNAPVFSPALDKDVLVIKINEDFLPQNLSLYDVDGYKDLLKELVDVIERQINVEHLMPDCMYEFFRHVLGEDKDGRIVDK